MCSPLFLTYTIALRIRRAIIIILNFLIQTRKPQFSPLKPSWIQAQLYGPCVTSTLQQVKLERLRDGGHLRSREEIIFLHHHLGEGNGNPLQYSCLENPMDGGAWQTAVHGVTKSQARLGDFTFTFHFHAMEEEMATHSSVLSWRIPGTVGPGGLLSMGLHRVGHD